MRKGAGNVHSSVVGLADSGRKGDAFDSRLIRGMGFVAVMALAAAAGYGWGITRRNMLAGEPRSAVRGDREKTVVTKVSSLTPVQFVREAVKGSLDERQHWQYVGGLSEEQVKAAMAETGNTGQRPDSSPELQAMLFYRWGELDPESANHAAKVMFPENFSDVRQAVITAWINRCGGSAAWNAVREESESWACTRSVPGEVSEMLVAGLSGYDDATAFREVARLDDENCQIADQLCRARAGRASATAESRAAFLAAAAAHPKPYVICCAREMLFGEWAKKDVGVAREGVMALPVSEEERESLLWRIESVERDQKNEAERAAAGP